VCRTPTEAELLNPTVVVGDIGRSGCELLRCGPALNSFAHHYSYGDQGGGYRMICRHVAAGSDIGWPA